MKRFRVVVPWQKGLHLRPAAALVRVARRFRSKIFLRCGEQIADLRNALSILTLCATMGTSLEVSAAGDDERDAATAVEGIFTSVVADDSLKSKIGL